MTNIELALNTLVEASVTEISKSKKLAITFKEKGSVIFLVPSSKGGNVNLFNQCVAVADIVKFADQIIKDISQFDSIGDKLFVQTKGKRGISFRYNSE